ncbi:MAG: RibD family protein [Gemmatimonadota bacterium]|nr:RibD family protein [Gemmatimonadota bacterium]
MKRLDETTAWALVRAVRRAAPKASGTVSVAIPTRPEAWIEAAAGKREWEWRVSAPPDDEARKLLDLYLPIALTPDLVIGQLGQSLDGRIATEGGRSHYVTGPTDIVRLHRLRALADAVIVGAGTVVVDDPRLTVRVTDGDNPVRVVLDPDAKLEPDRRVFTDGAVRTLWVCRAHEARSSDVGKTGDLLPHGSRPEVLKLPVGTAGFEPRAVLGALRARGLRWILVEGGGITVSRFLEAGALDRLHISVAPLLIGSGRPALTLPPVTTLDAALRPRCRHFHLGEDLLFDLDLG